MRRISVDFLGIKRINICEGNAVKDEVNLFFRQKDCNYSKMVVEVNENFNH